MKKRFLIHTGVIPLVIAITLLSGLLYFVLQQYIRSSANDPQIQLAEDLAFASSQGQPFPSAAPSSTVDLAKSLANFVIAYDSTGKVVFSDATLDGKAPTLPSSVLANAKKTGEARFTWQPKPGVRIAAVLTPYSGQSSGLILVGRSLKEVEKREDDLTKQVLIGWLVTVGAVLISTKLLSRSAAARP